MSATDDPPADMGLAPTAPDAATASPAAESSPSTPASAGQVTDDAAVAHTSIKSIGTAVDRNARYRRTMEDEHIFVDRFAGDDSTGYFGIYDGHGGRQVVERVKAELHSIFEKLILAGELTIAEAWKKAYADMDQIIADEKIMFSGTTAATVLLQTEDGVRKLHAANAGDARIVLVRAKKGVRLTHDHKASDPEEVARIQEAGGFVIMNRVNGMLAVTRALGDLTMKDHVTCEPYTFSIDLIEEDTHLIVACDGVWDVMEDDEAAALVAAASTSQEAATRLLRQSLKAGSTDNISVMVVEL